MEADRDRLGTRRKVWALVICPARHGKDHDGAFAVLTCAWPARAQTAATTTDGEAITEDEIAQRAKLDFLGTHKQPARDDVARELASDKDAIRLAEKQGVTSTDADVDRMYAAMTSHMHLTPEQLTKSLEGQGVHVETLKKRIKADMARQSLARMRPDKSQDDLKRQLQSAGEPLAHHGVRGCRASLSVRHCSARSASCSYSAAILSSLFFSLSAMRKLSALLLVSSARSRQKRGFLMKSVISSPSSVFALTSADG